jgi:hypothetical protein
MILDTRTVSIVPKCSLQELEVDRRASQYIEDNLDILKKIVACMPSVSADRVDDLIQDLYVSVLESENDGCGFSEDYGTEDGEITVQGFVIGRAKKYAYNPKYNSNVVQLRVNSHTKSEEFRVVAASFNEETFDENDEFQVAYQTACISDTLSKVDEMASIREQIEYCIDICNCNGINILNIFKRLNEFKDTVVSSKKGIKNVLNKLHGVLAYNDELYSNLMDVVTFALKNETAWMGIIAEY